MHLLLVPPSLPRCQPTYEELKPVFYNVVLNPSAGCQPTYEELKPELLWRGGKGRSGCQPTYEELKLILYRIPFFLRIVASLPMRN